MSQSTLFTDDSYKNAIKDVCLRNFVICLGALERGDLATLERITSSVLVDALFDNNWRMGFVNILTIAQRQAGPFATYPGEQELVREVRSAITTFANRIPNIGSNELEAFCRRREAIYGGAVQYPGVNAMLNFAPPPLPSNIVPATPARQPTIPARRPTIATLQPTMPASRPVPTMSSNWPTHATTRHAQTTPHPYHGPAYPTNPPDTIYPPPQPPVILTPIADLISRANTTTTQPVTRPQRIRNPNMATAPASAPSVPGVADSAVENVEIQQSEMTDRAVAKLTEQEDATKADTEGEDEPNRKRKRGVEREGTVVEEAAKEEELMKGSDVTSGTDN